MSEVSEFANQFLKQIAGGLGMSYEQMAAQFIPLPPALTPKMIRLCASGDRRKFKRGLRIYHTVNGPGAPHSYLFGHVNMIKMKAGLAALQKSSDRLYQAWLAENMAAIECGRCCARGPLGEDGSDVEEKAWAAWDNRG